MRFRAGYLINQVQHCYTCHFRTGINHEQKIYMSTWKFLVCGDFVRFSRSKFMFMFKIHSSICSSEFFREIWTLFEFITFVKATKVFLLFYCNHRRIIYHRLNFIKKSSLKKKDISISRFQGTHLKMQTTSNIQAPGEIIPRCVSHRNHVSPGRA